MSPPIKTDTSAATRVPLGAQPRHEAEAENRSPSPSAADAPAPSPDQIRSFANQSSQNIAPRHPLFRSAHPALASVTALNRKQALESSKESSERLSERALSLLGQDHELSKEWSAIQGEKDPDKRFQKLQSWLSRAHKVIVVAKRDDDGYRSALADHQGAQKRYLNAALADGSVKNFWGERLFLGEGDTHEVELVRRSGRVGVLEWTKGGSPTFRSADGRAVVRYSGNTSSAYLNGRLARKEQYGENDGIALQGKFDASGNLIDGNIVVQHADGRVTPAHPVLTGVKPDTQRKQQQSAKLSGESGFELVTTYPDNKDTLSQTYTQGADGAFSVSREVFEGKERISESDRAAGKVPGRKIRRETVFKNGQNVGAVTHYLDGAKETVSAFLMDPKTGKPVALETKAGEAPKEDSKDGTYDYVTIRQDKDGTITDVTRLTADGRIMRPLGDKSKPRGWYVYHDAAAYDRALQEAKGDMKKLKPDDVLLDNLSDVLAIKDPAERLKGVQELTHLSVVKSEDADRLAQWIIAKAEKEGARNVRVVIDRNLGLTGKNARPVVVSGVNRDGHIFVEQGAPDMIEKSDGHWASGIRVRPTVYFDKKGNPLKDQPANPVTWYAGGDRVYQLREDTFVREDGLFEGDEYTYNQVSIEELRIGPDGRKENVGTVKTYTPKDEKQTKKSWITQAGELPVIEDIGLGFSGIKNFVFEQVVSLAAADLNWADESLASEYASYVTNVDGKEVFIGGDSIKKSILKRLHAKEHLQLMEDLDRDVRRQRLKHLEAQGYRMTQDEFESKRNEIMNTPSSQITDEERLHMLARFGSAEDAIDDGVERGDGLGYFLATAGSVRILGKEATGAAMMMGAFSGVSTGLGLLTSSESALVQGIGWFGKGANFAFQAPMQAGFVGGFLNNSYEAYDAISDGNAARAFKAVPHALGEAFLMTAMGREMAKPLRAKAPRAQASDGPRLLQEMLAESKAPAEPAASTPQVPSGEPVPLTPELARVAENQLGKTAEPPAARAQPSDGGIPLTPELARLAESQLGKTTAEAPKAPKVQKTGSSQKPDRQMSRAELEARLRGDAEAAQAEPRLPEWAHEAADALDAKFAAKDAARQQSRPQPASPETSSSGKGPQPQPMRESAPARAPEVLYEEMPVSEGTRISETSAAPKPNQPAGRAAQPIETAKPAAPSTQAAPAIFPDPAAAGVIGSALLFLSGCQVDGSAPAPALAVGVGALAFGAISLFVNYMSRSSYKPDAKPEAKPAPEPQTFTPHEDGHDFVIGRHPGADLRLNDKGVSKTHAVIHWDNGWYLLDGPEGDEETSLNGIRVNGKKMTGKRIELHDGDIIELPGKDGPIRLKFEDPGEPMPETMPFHDPLLGAAPGREIEIFIRGDKKKYAGKVQDTVQKNGQDVVRVRVNGRLMEFPRESIVAIRGRGKTDDLTSAHSRVSNPQFPDKSVNRSGLHGNSMAVLVDFSDARLTRFLDKHIAPIREKLDQGQIDGREAAEEAWRVIHDFVPYDRARGVDKAKKMPSHLFGLGDFVESGVCNERGMLLQVALQYLGIDSRMEKGPFRDGRHAWVRARVDGESGTKVELILDPQRNRPFEVGRESKADEYRDDSIPFAQDRIGTVWMPSRETAAAPSTLAPGDLDGATAGFGPVTHTERMPNGENSPLSETADTQPPPARHRRPHGDSSEDTHRPIGGGLARQAAPARPLPIDIPEGTMPTQPPASPSKAPGIRSKDSHVQIKPQDFSEWTPRQEVAVAVDNLQYVYEELDGLRRSNGYRYGPPTSPVEVLESKVHLLDRMGYPLENGQVGIEFKVGTPQEAVDLVDHIAQNAADLGQRSMPLKVVERRGPKELILETPSGRRIFVRVWALEDVANFAKAQQFIEPYLRNPDAQLVDTKVGPDGVVKFTVRYNKGAGYFGDVDFYYDPKVSGGQMYAPGSL